MSDRNVLPKGLSDRIATNACRQHGLITRAQLIVLGLSEQAIGYRIRTGQLVTIHPGVYRLAGVPESWDQLLLAAHLAAGEASAISHLSAGMFWDFEGIESRQPDVLVMHSRKLDLTDVWVHRTRILPARDVTQRNGFLVTVSARTLLDIAGIVTRIELEVALDDALRRRIATLDRVRTCLDDRGPNGVKGWGRLDKLVAERQGVKPTGSGKETRFRRGLIDRGLPLPIAQYDITDDNGRFLARVDFAYPEIKLAIEVDSPPHADRLRWESDLRRQNRVNLMRWHFLRFPKTDRKGQREAFETIEAALKAFGEGNAKRSSVEHPKRPKREDFR